MVLIFPRQLARQSFVGYTTGVIKYFRILVLFGVCLMMLSSSEARERNAVGKWGGKWIRKVRKVE